MTTLEKVQRVLQEEIGQSVLPHTKISDLDLDSLDFLDLLLAIQRETGADIPDSVVAHIDTVADLVKACEGTLVAN